MIHKIQNKKDQKNQEESGFIKLIVLIITALLLMRYFGITISGTLEYFNLTWVDILGYVKATLDWLKELFYSVK